MKPNFSAEYNYLLKGITDRLKYLVSNSNIVSKHIVGVPCIEVNVFDYTELVIWDNDLTFLSSDGLQFSLFADCDIEDLIDIINEIEVKQFTK